MQSRIRRAAIALVVALAAVAAWIVGARVAATDPPPGGPIVPLAAGSPASLTPLLPTTSSDPANQGLGDASGVGPEALILAPDGGSLLSADREGGLHVLDLRTRSLTATPVGIPLPLTDDTPPHDLAIGPEGRTVYLTDPAARALRVVDLATRRVVGTVPVSAMPTAVAATPDGRHVEVADATGAITTIDTSTRAVTGSAHVATSITGLSITPDGKRLIAVARGSRTLTVLDTGDAWVRSGHSVTLPHPVATDRGNGSVAVAPDGTRAYVVTRDPNGPDRGDDGVAVVDLAAESVVTYLPTQWPFAVAVSPDSRHLHLLRAPEVTRGSVVVPLLTVETLDVGAGFRKLGSVADIASNYPSPLLVPSADGRRLYLDQSGTVSVVDLR